MQKREGSKASETRGKRNIKYAAFSRHKYIDGQREMYSIWLRVHDGEIERFHGPVTEYRVYGWDRHTAQLIIDSMKLSLTIAGFEVIGDA